MATALSSLLILSYKSTVLYNELCESTLKRYNLSPYERDVIIFLDNGQIDTATEIVKYRMVSKSLICKAISSLIANGFVNGERDKKDRRIIHLSLTPKGADIANEFKGIAEKYYQTIENGISDDELERFQDTARRLYRNADDYFSIEKIEKPSHSDLSAQDLNVQELA